MDEHQERADELLEDADRIQEPSDNLKRNIRETHEDWQQKKQQEAVPGAMEIEEDKPEAPEPNTYEFEQRSSELKAPESLDEGGDDSDDDDS
jgi:hypothetical protein